MEYTKCSADNCGETGSVLVDGIHYCFTHHNQVLFQRLDEHYELWDHEAEPPERFIYLLGRLCDSFEQSGSYLSSARIRNRAFNWVKDKEGCRFEITRHHGAWGNSGFFKQVVQRWQVNMAERKLILLGERDFEEGDYDH